MDLKQEVSLSALKRGKAPAYPVKTSINLVDTQQQRGNLLAQLGLFAIALVLIGVFAKFAVVDPLAASAASSNEVSAAQARLDVLAAENADYAELNAQYDRYVVPGLSEEEQNLVDRDVVLNLLQQKVMGVGHLFEQNTGHSGHQRQREEHGHGYLFGSRFERGVRPGGKFGKRPARSACDGIHGAGRER